MNARATPQLCLELKARAKELARTEGIKHTAALTILAQREGFRSWEELLGLAGGRDALDAAKPITEASLRRAERSSDRRRRFGAGS